MSIYDEKKSKNNHNDCDLDFGDYTDLYKSHSLCDNRTSIETMQDAEIIQRGAHIAAVYVTAEYENIEVHYTLAFNEDMKLASFGIQ